MIVDQRLTVCAVEGAEEQVRGRVIGEDLAVAEVADEEIVAERAEVGGSQDNSPGRGERATGCDALDEVAICVELTHDATGQRSSTGAKRGVGYVEVASDVLDVEGDETCRQARVGECAG